MVFIFGRKVAVFRYDLRGATDLNSLSKGDQKKIWSPSVGFTNARIIGGSKVDSITKTLVMRVGESLPDDIARSIEASVYDGVDGYIIMSREYFIDWTCDYELVYYPFDTQVRQIRKNLKDIFIKLYLKVCKMMFEMSGVTRQYVDLEVDYDGVEYTGQRTLLEYVVGDMMLKNIGNSTDSEYAGRLGTNFAVNLGDYGRYEGVTIVDKKMVLSCSVSVSTVSSVTHCGLHYFLLQS